MLIKKIKIVHVHGASYKSFWRKWIIINLCCFFRVKTIYHIHGGGFKLFYQRHSRIVKRTLSKVNAVVVLSESWKRFFSGIVDKDKIFIVNNIVENPGFQRWEHCDPQEREHCDPRPVAFPVVPIKFLFLGLIGDAKGIFDLLEVINANKEYLADKFVLHVGGNGETERLHSFIEMNRLEELVKFEGWVSGDKKRELLSHCDVYVLPSYNEGLPISILEAMSYSMPVISTNVGGIPEIVSDNENGFLMEPGDKNKMWECIDFYLNNPMNIKHHGEASADKVVAFYPGSVISQLEKIYTGLLTPSIECSGFRH